MSVPVAVFAFNRADHLQRTLDALARNEGAADTDVTIFCDGPRNAMEQEKTDAVRRLAHGARGFRRVKVIEQARNLGLEQSLIGGIGALLKEHPSVIVVEDDVVTAPYFLRYMNSALQQYADVAEVGSVSGYAYPVPASDETYFLCDFECWGWGTWRRSWNEVDWDGAALLAQLRARGLKRAFDRNGAYPFLAMLEDQVAGRTKSWAIRARASMFLRGRLTLYPCRSLVVNIGADGSGTSAASDDGLFFRQHAEHPVTVEARIPRADVDAAAAVTAFLRRNLGFLARLRRRLARLRGG